MVRLAVTTRNMTATEFHPLRCWARTRRRLAVGAAAAGLLAAGCSDPPESVIDDAAVAGPAAELSAVAGISETTAVVAAAVAEVETSETVQAPEDALAAALAALGDRYEFRSAVTSISGESISVTGWRVANALQFELEAGGAVVEVVIVGSSTWVRADGEDVWAPSGETAGADPIAPLSQPLEVGWDAETPGRLHARYVGSSVGLGTDSVVSVVVDISQTTLTFWTAVDDLDLRVTLEARGDLPAIEAPG